MDSSGFLSPKANAFSIAHLIDSSQFSAAELAFLKQNLNNGWNSQRLHKEMEGKPLTRVIFFSAPCTIHFACRFEVVFDFQNGCWMRGQEGEWLDSEAQNNCVRVSRTQRMNLMELRLILRCCVHRAPTLWKTIPSKRPPCIDYTDLGVWVMHGLSWRWKASGKNSIPWEQRWLSRRREGNVI